MSNPKDTTDPKHVLPTRMPEDPPPPPDAKGKGPGLAKTSPPPDIAPEDFAWRSLPAKKRNALLSKLDAWAAEAPLHRTEAARAASALLRLLSPKQDAPPSDDAKPATLGG